MKEFFDSHLHLFSVKDIPLSLFFDRYLSFLFKNLFKILIIFFVMLFVVSVALIVFVKFVPVVLIVIICAVLLCSYLAYIYLNSFYKYLFNAMVGLEMSCKEKIQDLELSRNRVAFLKGYTIRYFILTILFNNDMGKLLGHLNDLRDSGVLKDNYLFLGVNNHSVLDRNSLVSIFKEYDATGFKVYPYLGFDPLKVMDNTTFFSYCSCNNIPIVVHCDTAGLALGKLFVKDNEGKTFSNPKRWITVLEEFPNLKICFAHFGGKDKRWRGDIINLMRCYDNVYTDISFHFGSVSLLKNVKRCILKHKIFDKVLFGSDYPIMFLLHKKYEYYLNNYYKVFGQELVEKLNENAKKFIGR